MFKNNQNEYIESKGNFVYEICWGIGVKKRSKYPKLKNSSILIRKRTTKNVWEIRSNFFPVPNFPSVAQ